MYKILILSFFIYTTFANATDETYVFEAKGEFAKELKALVEKYSKEGKIDAKVYIKKTDNNSIVDSIFSNNKTLINGEKLYKKKCASCHGVKGVRAPGYGARAMNTMTKDEIDMAIQNYKSDMQYGGSGKFLMQGVAVALRKVELDAIVAYVMDETGVVKNNSTEQIKNSKPPASYLQ